MIESPRKAFMCAIKNSTLHIGEIWDRPEVLDLINRYALQSKITNESTVEIFADEIKKYIPNLNILKVEHGNTRLNSCNSCTYRLLAEYGLSPDTTNFETNCKDAHACSRVDLMLKSLIGRSNTEDFRIVTFYGISGYFYE